jgi:hypothetical protein
MKPGSIASFRSAAELPDRDDDEETQKREGHWKPCIAHPHGEGSHEIMSGELRCVYCGTPLLQPRCNGCDRWISIVDARDGETRCEVCR